MAIKIRVKLVPRLREAGMYQNEIARSQGMSRHSVGDVVAGARGLGISTIFCTQYRKKDWLARLDADVRADAIMDRIVHNTVWVARATST